MVIDERFYELLAFIGIVASVYMFRFIFGIIRSIALARIAVRLDMQFLRSGRRNTLDDHEKAGFFNFGSRKKIRNEIWGLRGQVNYTIFDYSVFSRKGGESKTYRKTVLSIQDNRLNLPDFNLRPEDLIEKVIQYLGKPDIDFENFPMFSSNYRLIGENEDEILGFFTPELLRFFEKTKGVYMEGRADRFIFSRSSRLCVPNSIPSILEDGEKIRLAFTNLKV